MSSLRLTFASYDDEPPQGGQGVVLAGMRRALEARGVQVATVAGRGARAVRHPRVIGRAPLDFSVFLNLHPEVLTAAAPDVVHGHGGPGGVLLLRRLPVPLVYTAHHTYRQAHRLGRPARLLAPVEARAYRRAAMVLPVSASTAAAVRAMGVPAPRIEVIPPGIDVPDHVDDQLREPRLLFVGRLEAEKGVLDAIAVMSALIGEGSCRSAAIVGTGSLAAAAHDAAASSSAAIEVLGAVDAAELSVQYARAAVVVMPSRYEGLGLVALEAMAAGAAVAGYDVDGLRDAVAGGGGLLVPAGGVAALREACRSLLDGGRREEAVTRGRAHVAGRYGWPAVAARLEQVYRAVAQ